MQPYGADGRTPDGDPQLAIDNLGAGLGATVAITSDGRSTRALVKDDKSPVRWSVIGIKD